jgi:hypothetical protein
VEHVTEHLDLSLVHGDAHRVMSLLVKLDVEMKDVHVLVVEEDCYNAIHVLRTVFVASIAMASISNEIVA